MPRLFFEASHMAHFGAMSTNPWLVLDTAWEWNSNVVKLSRHLICAIHKTLKYFQDGCSEVGIYDVKSKVRTLPGRCINFSGLHYGVGLFNYVMASDDEPLTKGAIPDG